jgi:hypothetical protein
MSVSEQSAHGPDVVTDADLKTVLDLPLGLRTTLNELYRVQRRVLCLRNGIRDRRQALSPCDHDLSPGCEQCRRDSVLAQLDAKLVRCTVYYSGFQAGDIERTLLDANKTIASERVKIEDLERRLLAAENQLGAATSVAKARIVPKTKAELAEEPYADQKQRVLKARAEQLRVNNGILVHQDHAKLTMRNRRWHYGNVEVTAQEDIEVCDDQPIWVTATGRVQRCIDACSGFHNPSHCPRLLAKKPSLGVHRQQTRNTTQAAQRSKANHKRPPAADSRKSKRRKRAQSSSLMAVPPHPKGRGDPI